MSTQRIAGMVVTSMMMVGLSHAVTLTTVFYTASAPPPGYSSAVQIDMRDAAIAEARPASADGANAITHFGKELSGGSVRLLIDCNDVFETVKSNVSSARLSLYHWASRARTNVAWNANLLTTAWEEQEASWNNAGSGTPWGTPGGDYAATPTSAGTVTCDAEGRHEFDVTALMDAYAKSPFAYHGLVLRSDDAHGAEPMYFGIDNGMMDVAQQPYLVVAYEYADDVPPQVVIENPANGVTSRLANIIVSGSAWDDSGIAEVRVNGAVAAGLSQWEAPVTLSAGRNKIEAIAKDTSGNSATATIYVVYDSAGPVDEKPPVIVIQNPANGVTSPVRNVTVSGVAWDDVDVASVTVNGAVASGLSSWRIDLNLNEGANTIHAIARDNAGNAATDTIVVVVNTGTTPDTQAPLIRILSPPNGSTSPVAAIMVSGMAWDNTDLSNVTVTASGTGVSMPATGLTDWRAGVVLVPGPNVITATATDSSGNTAADAIVVYYDPNRPPDTTPPTITILNPLHGTTSQVATVTISGVANDDVSVAEVRVNGQLASGLTHWQIGMTLSVGPNVITAVAKDSSGNIASDSITVYYNPSAPPDTTPPVIVIENPADWTVSPVPDITVSGHAHDNVDVARVTVNGLEPVGLTEWMIGLRLKVGTNVITAQAWDNSGLTAADTIHVIYDPGAPRDTQPPVVQITSPANGSTSGWQNITVAGIAHDNVAVAEVRLNGVLVGAGVNWTAYDVMLHPGWNTLTAVAKDTSGNTASDAIMVYFDHTLGPDVEIKQPYDGQVFPNGSQNIVVIGTATPGQSAITVLTLNGIPIAQGDLPNWQRSVTLVPGANMLHAYVQNAAGYSDSDSITVFYDPQEPVDNEPPSLQILNPTDGALIPVLLTNDLTVHGTVIDDTGVASVSVRVEPLMSTAWNVPLYDQPMWYGGAIQLQVGVNRIIATATDFQGNICVVTNVVTVTTTPPTPDMVIDIMPRQTWNSGQQQTVITGKNFQAGCRFYLTGIGPAIEANPADVVIGGVKAYALFDVDGVQPGLRNVMAVNPDGSWGIRNDLFMINSMGEITNPVLHTPWIERVAPDVLTNAYNWPVVIYGSNFYNVQSVMFRNSAGYWFRGINIDVERSTLTSVYCTAMCGTDLGAQVIPRPTGLFGVEVTAINNLTGQKADVVNLVAGVAPLAPADVTIELSNDYKHIIVRWNGPDTANVWTNAARYYSVFAPGAAWMLARTAASMPLILDASTTPSLYLHLQDPTGVLNAPYDVGKFDVTLVGGDATLPGISWVAPPLNLFDRTLKGTFKNQLAPEAVPPKRDQIQYQQTFGGAVVVVSYDGTGQFVPYAEFPRDGAGMIVLRKHAGDVKLTFTGWVPTNSYVIGPLPKSNGASSVNIWLNPLYPTPVNLDASGLGESGVVTPALAPPQRDKVQQQKDGVRIMTSYGNGAWMGAAEFKTLWPGGMFMLEINPAHTGSATNWMYPKPY